MDKSYWKFIGYEEQKLVADILMDNDNLPGDNKLLYWEFCERHGIEYPAKDKKEIKSQKNFVNKMRYMRKKIKNGTLPCISSNELAEILRLSDNTLKYKIEVLSNHCSDAKYVLKHANPYGHKADWTKGEITNIQTSINSLSPNIDGRSKILKSITEYNEEYGLNDKPIETITELHLYQMAIWRHMQKFDTIIPREVEEIEQKIKEEFSSEYPQELCEEINGSN